jgi:hypothetical protein
LPHATEITNNAAIFFDFNPAIVTNTVGNQIFNAGDLTAFHCNELGFSEPAGAEMLQLYPNPTSGLLTVDFGQELQHAELIVIDLQGKEVARKTVNDQLTVTLDLSELQNGVYLLSVRDRNGKLIEQNRKISRTNG